jgi:hypothetical protein
MSYDTVTFREPKRIDRSAGYFTLPAFTYSFSDTGPHAGSQDYTVDDLTLTADINDSRANPLKWNGASQRITQWNYSSTNNFVLTELPEPPVDSDFCLCIAYRVGDEVYRYKLWEGIGEVLNVPLYTSQIIKKYFSLEVWSTESSDEVNLGTAIQLTSSIRAVMTDVTDTFEVVEGVEAANQLYETPTVTVDTTNLVTWYRGDVSQLTVDAVGTVSAATLYQGTGPNMVATAGLKISDVDPTLYGHSFAEANTVKSLYTSAATTGGRQWLAVVKVPVGIGDTTVIVAPGFILETVGTKFNVSIGGVVSEMFDLVNDWIVINVSITDQGTDNLFTVSVTDIEGKLLYSATETSAAALVIVDGVFTVKSCYFADFVTFSDVTDVSNYIKAIQLFYGLFLTDMTLNSNTVLVDNA